MYIILNGLMILSYAAVLSVGFYFLFKLGTEVFKQESETDELCISVESKHFLVLVTCMFFVCIKTFKDYVLIAVTTDISFLRFAISILASSIVFYVFYLCISYVVKTYTVLIQEGKKEQLSFWQITKQFIFNTEMAFEGSVNKTTFFLCSAIYIAILYTVSIGV